jgi:membrane protein YqaA with SNARE-associated domain
VAGVVDGTLLLLVKGAPEQTWRVAFLAAAGSVLGMLALFLAARKGGGAYVARHALGRRAAVLRNWFHRYGLLTLFSSAVAPIIPTPLKVFVICAGASGVDTGSFLWTLFVARMVRYSSLAWLATEMRGNALPYLKPHGWHLMAATKKHARRTQRQQ